MQFLTIKGHPCPIDKQRGKGALRTLLLRTGGRGRTTSFWGGWGETRFGSRAGLTPLGPSDLWSRRGLDQEGVCRTWVSIRSPLRSYQLFFPGTAPPMLPSSAPQSQNSAGNTPPPLCGERSQRWNVGFLLQLFEKHKGGERPFGFNTCHKELDVP